MADDIFYETLPTKLRYNAGLSLAKAEYSIKGMRVVTIYLIISTAVDKKKFRAHK
jgi:hypothetical protein